MAQFVFDFKIQTDFTDVKAAKEELKKMTGYLDEASKEENRVNINSEEILLAQKYTEALDKAIKRVEKEGGKVGDKLDKELRLTGTTTERLSKELDNVRRKSNSEAGQGIKSISRAAKIATQDIKTTDTQLDRLKRNIQEGFGQTIAFGAIGAVTGAFTSAVYEVAKLDKTMTQISIVSGKTRTEMEAFRDAAFESADALGANAKALMEASLIYEQQGGLAAQYSEELAKATVLGANIDDTGNDAQQISEYMTAVMNGFDMLKEKGGETGTYIMDVLSQLGAVSGSSLGEMSEGLQRTANIARLSGYDFEEISAAIATVSEVTRRSASTIGNGFKSILLSFQQLREAGAEEVEAFTNKIQKAFDATGLEIKMFDNDELRDAKDIMNDIGDQWSTMNKEQQAMVSEAIAGKYQAEVFQAFMENQDRYRELIGEAYSSAGIAAQQQLIYMDSLQAKTEQFKNAWQETSSIIMNTDMMKNVVAQATTFLETINATESSLGAVVSIGAPLAGIFGQLFGGKYASEMSQRETIKNLQKDIAKTIQGYEHLSQAAKDAVLADQELGMQQQEVLENLGGSAAAAYRAAQEELRRLEEEHKSLIAQQESDVETIHEKYKRNFGLGGGFDSQEIRRAAQEAVETAKEAMQEQADSEKRIIDRRIETYKELEQSFARMDKRGKQEEVSNRYRATLRDIYFQTLELSKELEVGTQEQLKSVDAKEKILAMMNDENATQSELRAHIEEQLGHLREINKLSEERLKTTQKQELAEVKKAAELEAIKQQHAQTSGGVAEEIELNRQSVALAEAQSEALEKGAQRAGRLQRAVEMVSGSVTALGPAFASLNAYMKGSITQGEAFKQTMTGISTSLLMSRNPYLMAAGGITFLIGQFVDMRSEMEKVKEANEDMIRNFVSMKEEVYNARGAVLGMKEEFEAFEGVNITNLLATGTEEDITRYISLSEKIASVAPELVKYYNAEGVAIVDMTQGYEKLLNAKREEVRIANEYMTLGRTGFIKETSSEMKQASADLAVGVDKLNQAKDALRNAEKAGDTKAASEALGEVQKFSSQITDAQGRTKELSASINANIVRPFLEGNKELSTMLVSQDKNIKKIGEEINSLFADALNGDILGDMFSSGMESQAEVILNTLDDLGKHIDALDKKSKGAFVESLKELGSAELNTAILTTGGNIERVLDIINGKSTVAETSFNTLQDSMRDLSREQELLAQQSEIASGALSAGADSAFILNGVLVGAGIALAPFTAGLSTAATAGIALSGGLATAAASMSLAAAGTESYREQIKKTQKAEEDLNRVRDSVISSTRQAAKTQEGFNTAMERTKDVDKAIKGLKNYNKELQEASNSAGFSKANQSLKEYIKSFPELEAKYGDISNASESTMASIASDLQTLQMLHEDMMYGMTLDSEEYFTEWKIKEADRVDFARETYGIDAENYRTMAEYKTALEAMSAADFHNYQALKVKSGAEANQLHAENSTRSAWEIAKQWGSSIGTTIDNFHYFSSESMTITDKIKFAFLSLGDILMNTFIAIFNTIMSIFNDFLNKFSQGINSVVKMMKGALSGLIGAYNWVANKIPGMEAASGKIVDWANSDTEEAKNWGDFRLDSVDYAGSYARDTISKRENQKAAAIKDMTQFSGDAFSGMGGFKGLEQSLAGTGGAAPKTRPIPQAGKGAGKSGKGAKEKKEKEKKDVADLELELDRYYKLDDALAVIDDKLKTISRTKDQAYGNDKIAAMEREQKQIAAQEQVLSRYVKALQQEQAEKRKALSSQGFKFDGQGEITNLNERLTAMQNAANKKTGEAKEKAIEEVKKIQEEANRYLNLTFTMIPDKKQAMQDAKALVKQIERQKIEYKVQLKIDRTDLAREVRDTMKLLNEEDYSKLDENLVITGQQLKDNIDLVKYYQDQIKAVEGNKNLTEDDRQELIKQYKSDMLSAIGDAQGAYKEMLELQQKFIDDTVEMLDKTTEGFEGLHDKAEKLGDLFGEIYGSQAYQQIAKFRDAQIKSVDAQLRALSQVQQELIYYRDSLKKGTKEWEAANDAVNNLGVQIEDSLIKRIEILQQKFAEFMEGLLLETDKSIFGSLGLEEYEAQLEKLLEKNDKMLNTYDKLTQIGSFIAEVNREIANSTDPAQAEAYRKFREEELESLMKADKVSADELERAKMLWEIRQKEQALEDRKNASRMAQLVRDENGNMSYEYVRQESETDSGAERELASAKNDLYKFDNEKIQESSRNVLAIIAETNEKIKRIYEDNNLSEAEKKAALELAYKQAKDEIAEAQEDIILWSGYAMKDGIDELKNAFQRDQVSFEPMGIDNDSIKKVFDAMDAGQLSVGQMLSGDLSDFASSMGMSVEEATKAVNAILSTAGSESARYSQEIIDRSNEWLNATQENLEVLAQNYGKTQSEINSTTNLLEQSTGDLTAQIDKNSQAADANAKKIREQAIEMVAAGKATDNTANSFRQLTNALVGSSGGGGTLGAMVSLREDMNKKLQASLVETKKRSDQLAGSANTTAGKLQVMGNTADYSFRMTRQFDSETIRQANNNLNTMSNRAKSAASDVKRLGDNAVVSRQNIAGLSVALAALPGLDSGKRHYYTVTNPDGSTQNVSHKNKQNVPGGQYVGYFDTGGYTGEWTGSSGNQEGKFLMAHEKELVLNKEDTQNFLEGVQIQRQLMRAIGGGMSDVVSALVASSPSITNNETSKEVNIYADFPSVTSSNEIQTALESLSLNAASYAYKKK